MLTWFIKWIKPIGNKYVRMTIMSVETIFVSQCRLRVRKGTGTVTKGRKKNKKTKNNL